MNGAHSNKKKKPIREAVCPQSLTLHRQMKRVIFSGGGGLWLTVLRQLKRQ